MPSSSTRCAFPRLRPDVATVAVLSALVDLSAHLRKHLPCNGYTGTTSEAHQREDFACTEFELTDDGVRLIERLG